MLPPPAPPLVGSRRQPELTRQLAGFGGAPALLAGPACLSYGELADRVATAAKAFGPVRRLVLVAGSHELDCVVGYLGALAGGHAVLLVPGEDDVHLQNWIDTYDPDVVVRSEAGRWAVRERRQGSAHDLHPELALLLSTSGSTGSPKLVRLSYDNLDANAASIAVSLGIEGDDRAVSTLPMAYCYGLSVLHSHLLRGASVVLTGLSVVDDCFWRLCRDLEVTSLAGVPYTYQLLDRVDFLGRELPSLRQLTQAGGSMPAEQVRRYAEAGRERGWELVVMYGQTEATARMAYLPPELATSRPEAIGVAVPGGQLRLGAVDRAGVGELLYSGPNVMLGYAECAADLGLGRTVHELATGDLARQAPDGLFEVVGRRSRVAKVYGLRIDLHAVEAALAVEGVSAWTAGAGDALVVLAEPPTDRDAVRRQAAAAAGLPPRAVRVVAVDALPRTPRGKVDATAALALASQSPGSAERGAAEVAPGSVAALYAEVLGCDRVDDEDTFSSLGGDSLSYVEVSLRLEDELGHLPADWHVTPVGQLRRRPSRAARARLDTTVLLRAVGILLIVGSHAHVFGIRGGAHALVAVAGYNFARFRLTRAPRRDRVAGMWRGLRRLVVPSAVVIGIAAATTAQVGLTQVALLNGVLGPDVLGPGWRYWFVEALAQTLVLLSLLLAVPALDRAERRWPLAFPVVLLGLGMLTRFDVVALGPGPDRTQSAAALLWLFALGWCAARSRTTVHRVLISAAAVVLMAGFFGDRVQEAVVLGAVVLLVWTPSVALPRALAPLRPVLGVLAAASLYVYLAHWPVLDLIDGQPLLTAAAGLAVGLAVHRGTCLVRPLLAPAGAARRRVAARTAHRIAAGSARPRWRTPVPARAQG